MGTGTSKPMQEKLEIYKAPVPVAEVAVYHLWHVTEMFGKPKKQINLFYFATRIS